MTAAYALLTATLALLLAGPLAAQSQAAPAAQPLKVLPNQAVQPLKVLRYAFPVAETGFDLPAFNKLYEQQRSLPDGPERDALTQQALRLSLAYMPIKVRGHNIETWLTQPQVRGYVRHPVVRDFWRYVAVDGAVPAAVPAPVPASVP